MHRLARTVHGVVGWWAFLTSTTLHGLGILLSVLMFWDKDRRFALTSLRWCWGHLNMWLNPFWRVERRGLEHIGPGPYVVVCNHQSVGDIPNVVGLPLPIRLVAREGIAKVPVMRTFLRLARHIVADRLVDEGPRTLQKGISILIFPEGTRSIDGRIRRFHGGAFHLAKHTRAPILPIVSDNSRLVIPKGRFWPDQGVVRVKLQVLAPVHPDDFETPLELKQHVHRVMLTAMESL